MGGESLDCVAKQIQVNRGLGYKEALAVALKENPILLIDWQAKPINTTKSKGGAKK